MIWEREALDMSYSRVGLLAIILHVIINADTMFGKGSEDKHDSHKKYRYFLYSILVFYTMDIAWGIFTEYDLVIPSIINTNSFFFTMGLTVFLWMRFIRAYLNRKNFWSGLLRYSAWILFVTDIVVIIVNCFRPVIFYFEPNGDYVPLLGRRIILDVQIALFAIIAVYTLIEAGRRNDRERTHYIAIGVSGLLMALLIMLQLFYPLTPFYSMGLLIATSVIHSFVVVDERIEKNRKLGSYMRVAYKDPLTQVRNSNAYTESKSIVDGKIKKGEVTEFGVVVFDLNNLKTVNDTLGHDAGDKYIKDSCMLICHVFAHSPVFRIGGDEFVAILQKEDYVNRDLLVGKFNAQIDTNMDRGGPVVAAGMSVFAPGDDICFDTVFERADALMYARKKELKQKVLPVTS